jgi:hypothetical protein
VDHSPGGVNPVGNRRVAKAVISGQWPAHQFSFRASGCAIHNSDSQFPGSFHLEGKVHQFALALDLHRDRVVGLELVDG